MIDDQESKTEQLIHTISDLAKYVDYSFLNSLVADPQTQDDGNEHNPRQVFSGHYVPVTPTPIGNPTYVAHSHTLFEELGFDNSLAHTPEFMRLFSGDMTSLPAELRPYGWATGYALSIYGTEYIQQCPFSTGNGYGDGRALSVLEIVTNGKRFEMQLKGAGRTPYCRGADGRAVLRSSVREFLVQEHMHALGVPTSRSLSLFMSQSETVDRPWYLEGSNSQDPEVMVPNLVAISTRVAPSFIRVGQLELFGRRARSSQHPTALKELHLLAAHLIEREYKNDIDTTQPFESQLVALAAAFQDRLTSLVAHWVRVGYCQGNFNSDNCAAGGYTLDYGPFGFCELFDPAYQPWTGGGRHFSFLNQPVAAEKNFAMFCRAIEPLLADTPKELEALRDVNSNFATVMQEKMDNMWAAKLGLAVYDNDLLLQLLHLMMRTGVDYNHFFRELSNLPTTVDALKTSFYAPLKEDMISHWNEWLQQWRAQLEKSGDINEVATKMKLTNPKFTWREWLVVPAYKEAEVGTFNRIHALQEVLTKPYEEQSEQTQSDYYRLRPREFFGAGGISHYSCSS
ncbi:protein adenylyltransferase SelO [Alteromonas stellipolaris]|uniref:Protein nucleotidyltransferase YdiU n=1 Tax=Alteromonas stellipolaris TaxID=233316 RepID=A0AAW7Z7G6_9ALTE|nr:protein adenylyltransferase SelO family protein [Alteromonas stellipolaris]MDO6579558.1 protein adenylyltransferase SelO family protein [Alteromonas stellipolaris]MDP2537882.1 protein adenylyltransferase SelO family protein [Alteromonas stellipolaris]